MERQVIANSFRLFAPYTPNADIISADDCMKHPNSWV